MGVACEGARAKVNLTLHVTGRRSDGYHLLDSLVVFAEAGDLLCAEPSRTLSLQVTGPQAAGLQDAPDNLVLRAAHALAARVGGTRGARLTLIKRLPVASGIGGGSADAAASLRLLTRLWDVDIAPAELLDLATELGADVPVCLLGRAARMRGIGEVLDPAPALPRCGLVLLNPGQALPTPDVFRARTGPFSAPPELPEAWRDAAAMAADLAALSNDLEAAAIAICPAVAEVLAALRGEPDCLLARMSGSGATCFGLFPDAAAAERAAARLARPGRWHWGGALAA